MIVYDKRTGKIVAKIPYTYDMNIFFQHYPQEFRDNLASVRHIEQVEKLDEYKIVDNKLVRRSDVEIMEINRYGNVLTNEERLLKQLNPSYSKIQKAEMTIEILSLLQEVL